MNKKVRVIAFYLPQFHPTKENDQMWGRGFTEWTNVTKSKPLFKGHYQPQLPSDLGFYDLRLEQSRIDQAELAQDYGIEGFCYWHYWFGHGRTILEGPIQSVLKDKKPDFPFCLAWANHSWSNKTWKKTKGFTKDIVFIEQEYPGDEDYLAHFNYCLPFFKDERYIKVDGKPLFLVFNPDDIPDNKHFLDYWTQLAKENGFPGFYFVCRVSSLGNVVSDKFKNVSEYFDNRFDKYISLGYDAVNSANMRYMEYKCSGRLRMIFRKIASRLSGNIRPAVFNYKKAIKYLITQNDYRPDVHASITPRWDNSPRRGNEADLLHNATPELFSKHLDDAIASTKNQDYEHKILFLFAWNEWGEGAYIEPDIRYGRQHLEKLKEKVVADK